jgi:hypothetical protein
MSCVHRAGFADDMEGNGPYQCGWTWVKVVSGMA